tara:strand:- start:878 stop:985 length:108 start_codon:yes stop_codon:yes gene_type:complete
LYVITQVVKVVRLGGEEQEEDDDAVHRGVKNKHII